MFISLTLGELYVLREVVQSPQTEVPYPQTNGGQPCLGTLVAVVHISVTYICSMTSKMLGTTDSNKQHHHWRLKSATENRPSKQTVKLRLNNFQPLNVPESESLKKKDWLSK